MGYLQWYIHQLLLGLSAVLRSRRITSAASHSKFLRRLCGVLASIPHPFSDRNFMGLLSTQSLIPQRLRLFKSYGLYKTCKLFPQYGNEIYFLQKILLSQATLSQKKFVTTFLLQPVKIFLSRNFCQKKNCDNYFVTTFF